MLKAFENDFLMSHLFHVQLVEVVDGDVEQTTAGDIVVDEEMAVRKYWIVETCEKKTINDNINFKKVR